MLSLFDVMRAQLSYQQEIAADTNGITDIAAHYHYPRFAQALTKAGMATSLINGWPIVDEGPFLLFHTLSIDHKPMHQVQQHYCEDLVIHAVPLQTALPGALHSVLFGGATAAIEREGYGAWADGTSTTGEASGLVTTIDLAERAGLTTGQCFGEAARINSTASLPELLVRALSA